MVGSGGPLSENIGYLRHLENAGAGSVVLHSLFGEQPHKDRAELDYSDLWHHYLCDMLMGFQSKGLCLHCLDAPG